MHVLKLFDLGRNSSEGGNHVFAWVGNLVCCTRNALGHPVLILNTLRNTSPLVWNHPKTQWDFPGPPKPSKCSNHRSLGGTKRHAIRRHVKRRPFPGISTEFPGEFPRIFRGFPGDFLGKSLGTPKEFPGKSQGNPTNIRGNSPGKSLEFPGNGRRFT